MNIKEHLGRWWRQYWHDAYAVPTALPHYGTDTAGLAEHFDRMEYERKWTTRFGY